MTRVFDDWRLLPERIALHEPSATAVIADVHLGYHAARQQLGDAIPCRSVAEDMAPLIDAARRHRIDSVVVAGDLFERGFDVVLAGEFLSVLASAKIDFAGLVPGNHDRGIGKSSAMLPVFPDGLDLGAWHIIHGDQPNSRGHTLMGHWHPATRWQRRKVPCFLVQGHQLVLPAFSLDAAGVDVKKDVRWRGWTCCPIVHGKVICANTLGTRVRRRACPVAE
jgi:metallophosphoesterase superfamily enzyme